MLDTSNCRVSIVSLTDAFLIVFWVSWRNGSAIVSVERFSCKNLFTLPFWADFFILSLANKYLYSSAPHNILCTVFFTEPFLGRLLTPLLYFKEVGVQVRDDIFWTILLFFDCLFTAICSYGRHSIQNTIKSIRKKIAKTRFCCHVSNFAKKHIWWKIYLSLGFLQTYNI